MKFTALFLCALTITMVSSVQVKSSTQLAFESSVESLKKTGWGKIAVGLLQLQLQTEGPIDELETAFRNLIIDINFKINIEQEEYTWKAQENHGIEAEIRNRLRRANARAVTAQLHLNDLYPIQEHLEQLISNDETLISETETARENAIATRASNQATYEQNVEEHNTAIEAVEQCISLVEGLISGEGSLIQVKKAQTHLKKVSKKLGGLNEYTHIVQVLVTLSQDFADGAKTGKVLSLLNDILGNLGEALDTFHKINRAEIDAHAEALVNYAQTIADAQARLVRHNAQLTAVNAKIAHQEELFEVASAEEAVAQGELDEEIARWAAEVEHYNELMGELEKELAGVQAAIAVFAGAELNANQMNAAFGL